MSDFASLNGQRITSAAIAVPYYGAWVGDVTLATAAVVSGPATVVLGDLTLQGTIIRTATFAGTTTARLVAGGGGWRKTIAARAWRNASGVAKSLVANAVASTVGESVSIASDGPLGVAWTVANAPAERVLRDLAGPLWWVAPDGITHIGPRDTSAIGSPFTVVNRIGGVGRLTIATEVHADWMPGRTFIAPTVPDLQTISLSTFTVDNNGTLRVEVLAV